VLVLFAVLASYLNPLVGFLHTWSDARTGKEHLSELQRENAALKKRRDSLDNPAVLIQEARKQGMVLPGEHPYAVRGLKH
jgi:hypothetical protein